MTLPVRPVPEGLRHRGAAVQAVALQALDAWAMGMTPAGCTDMVMIRRADGGIPTETDSPLQMTSAILQL